MWWGGTLNTVYNTRMQRQDKPDDSFHVTARTMPKTGRRDRLPLLRSYLFIKSKDFVLEGLFPMPCITVKFDSSYTDRKSTMASFVAYD